MAYGPQAIVIVLAAAGAAALDYTLPVTIAIVVLLAVLVVSYRQVIEAFPGRRRRVRGRQPAPRPAGRACSPPPR